MKILICITAFMLMITSDAFSQSELDFESGTELILESGADLSADIIRINGSFSGGGTINGNPAYVLNLKVIIQGFYNSSADIMISDRATVYLRNAASPYEIIESFESNLDSTGVGTFIFSNALDAVNYYIVVRHRNSIETWSNSGNAFSSGSMVYDFTTASNKAYGNNLILVKNTPVRYAIYSGDADQNGVIDASDMSLIDNDGANFVTGYVNSDVTGDELVDASDAALVDNNGLNFVYSIHP